MIQSRGPTSADRKEAVVAGRTMAQVTREKAMFTVREAAEILCVTPHTVRSYIGQRKLRAVQRGDGYYLVHADDLRVFLGLDPDESLVPVSSS